MIIKPLKYCNAISFLEEIPTGGHSPIKVLADDYAFYIVKNNAGKTPAYHLINEVISHYFLKLWKIPTPEIALISINPEFLLPEYSNRHKPHFYNYPVFGSAVIPQATDCNAFISIEKRADYNKFLSPEVIFFIGLFDLWVENDDRKPTNNNLLLQPFDGKQRFSAIDHSFIFSSLDYSSLDPKFFCPIENDNIFVTDLAISLKKYKKKNKNWVQNDKKMFYLYVLNCKKHFPSIVKNIPKEWGFTLELQVKLKKFLFDKSRLEKVFHEYVYKMN